MGFVGEVCEKVWIMIKTMELRVMGEGLDLQLGTPFIIELILLLVTITTSSAHHYVTYLYLSILTLIWGFLVNFPHLINSII